MSQFPQAIQLPPRIPPDDDEISRAICLLGNRIAAELKEKTKKELIGLIGIYPTQEQAKYWKHALKQLLKDDSNGVIMDQMVSAEVSSELPKPASKPRKRRSKRYSQRYGKRGKSQQQAQQAQQAQRSQLRSRETLAANGYPFAGVSNFASIDLERFRSDDDWEY